MFNIHFCRTHAGHAHTLICLIDLASSCLVIIATHVDAKRRIIFSVLCVCVRSLYDVTEDWVSFQHRVSPAGQMAQLVESVKRAGAVVIINSSSNPVSILQ